MASRLLNSAWAPAPRKLLANTKLLARVWPSKAKSATKPTVLHSKEDTDAFKNRTTATDMKLPLLRKLPPSSPMLRPSNHTLRLNPMNLPLKAAPTALLTRRVPH